MRNNLLIKKIITTILILFGSIGVFAAKEAQRSLAYSWPSVNLDSTQLYVDQFTLPSPGQTVCIPIKVKNFSNVTSLQGSIHWDPAVLQFTDLDDVSLNLPGLQKNTTFFGITDVLNGTLTFRWEEPSYNLISKLDGDYIFELCFEVLKNNCSPTTIYFDGNPTSLEALSFLTPLPISTTPGSSNPSLGNLQITASSINLCPGTPSILNISNGYTKPIWNTGTTTPSITVSQGGTYTVTATDATGCKKTAAITIVAVAEKDLYSKDQTTDIGLEPNPNTYLYSSPSIKVDYGGNRAPFLGPFPNDNTFATTITHKNPKYDGPLFENNVSVQIINRGCLATGNGAVVMVYYRIPSASSAWPNGWISIGQVTLPQDLQPGEEAIVSVPWTPPTPTTTTAGTYLHTCLLSRIVYPDDPMTFPETGNNTLANTGRNNNIVWKNVNIITTGQRISGVTVANHTAANVNMRVQFGFNNFRRPFANNGNEVKFRPDIPIRQGIDEGLITPVNFIDDGESLTMTASRAWFEIPEVAPEMACFLELEFIMPNEFDPNLEDSVFQFVVEQFNDGELVGGVLFQPQRFVNDAPPEIPGDLNGQLSGATDAVLTWADLSNNEFGFIIQRSKNDTNNFQSLPRMAAQGEETYLDPGLEPNTTYFYRVKATNDFGTDSGYSNIVEVTTLRLSISGQITRPNFTPVPLTEVNLSGGLTDIRSTAADGTYAFENDLTSDFYEVRPYNNTDISVGLSNLDLILIKLHILGTMELCSPYSMIAADASLDASISNLDLIIIKQVILANFDEFPFGNTSWRFVPAAYDFPNPDDPFIFPEFLEFAPLTEARDDSDFIGIKTGDASGNCTAENRRQYGDPIELNLGEITAQKGQFIEIPIVANQIKDLETFQYTHTWNTDVLKFAGLGSFNLEGMSEKDFGLSTVNKGQLPVLWMASGENGVTLEDNTTIYTLRFEVIGEPNSQSTIALTSDLVEAQGFNHQLQQLDIIATDGNVRVAATTPSDAGGLLLYPNVPNPFSASTSLQFYLPTSGEVALTIYNSIGQKVMTQNGHFSKGMNQIEWSGKSQAPGIYFLHLTAEGQSATQKLLIKR